MTKGLPPLNIITPVSRPENLTAIYRNLSEINELDIRWFTIFDPLCASSVDEWSSHVQRTAAEPELPQSQFPVQIAVAGTSGGWGGSKRSYAMSVIDDGWCYFLDDDNLIQPDLARVFRRGLEEQPNAQVIVFHQARRDGSIRLHAAPENMRGCHFDTGQFVMKRSFIGEVDYAPASSPWSTIWPDVGVGDWNFIERFWNANPQHFHFVPEIGSYYNALRQ
jgi:hypothetical protein